MCWEIRYSADVNSLSFSFLPYTILPFLHIHFWHRPYFWAFRISLYHFHIYCAPIFRFRIVPELHIIVSTLILFKCNNCMLFNRLTFYLPSCNCLDYRCWHLVISFCFSQLSTSFILYVAYLLSAHVILFPTLTTLFLKFFFIFFFTLHLSFTSIPYYIVHISVNNILEFIVV